MLILVVNLDMKMNEITDTGGMLPCEKYRGLLALVVLS